MSKTILITGGAGFIGSHLTDALLARGHHVRVLDQVVAQVHGPGHARPSYLDPAAELLVGDVRDAGAVRSALDGVDVVYHLAAMVGVGQSMYQVDDYCGVNTAGTAVLMQALLERRVQRLIVASSMSIYGEGLYRAQDGTLVEGARRGTAQLEQFRWEPPGPGGAPLSPLPTPEDKRPDLRSVYALTKYDQEQLALMVGEAYGIPTVALRFFNVYGPRQALSNPYTGVLAIFAARLLNGRPPLIFEDGAQTRDFVSVHDVVRACVLAMEAPDAAGMTINVGSGAAHSVREVAARLARVLRTDVEAEVCGRHRVGDIRHCFADISRARRVLGYEPEVDLDQGLDELARWLRGQVPVDRVAQATEELAARGLTG